MSCDPKDAPKLDADEQAYLLKYLGLDENTALTPVVVVLLEQLSYTYTCYHNQKSDRKYWAGLFADAAQDREILSAALGDAITATLDPWQRAEWFAHGREVLQRIEGSNCACDNCDCTDCNCTDCGCTD